MEQGTIVKWHKKVGDKIEPEDLLVEIATDKATVEYNALDEGFLRKILVSENQTAIINQPIAISTPDRDESIEEYKPIQEVEKEKNVPEPDQPTQKLAPNSGISSKSEPAFIPELPLHEYDFSYARNGSHLRIMASPLAKKLAEQKGLDLSSVKGSGPRGRVVSRDLEKAEVNHGISFTKRDPPPIMPGTYEEIPLTPIQKIVGERLQGSKSFIPHFYIQQDIDAEACHVLREQLKQYGMKISFTDFVIRSVALALREHPSINSGFNSVTQSIVLFKTVDLSIAVSIQGGLITPIIRNADYKDLREIASEVKYLAMRAKGGHLKVEEYKGGSFTISNLGMFGISAFSAIINPPQAAILAVGAVEECARFKDGLCLPGKKMTITLSVDHRVINGDEAARFIKTVQKNLENPAILLV